MYGEVHSVAKHVNWINSNAPSYSSNNCPIYQEEIFDVFRKHSPPHGKIFGGLKVQ